MNQKKLVIKGSSLSALVLFTRIAVAFFLMPFIIRMLGDHDYGFWILISAFIGYYGMLDFGISGAVLRFVSREIGSGRKEETKYYINSALFVLCGLGLLIVAISFAASLGASFFITDKENLSFFRFAIIILGLSIGLSFPLRVFDGVLGAHLRFDLKRYVEFGELVLRTGAIVIFLEMGYGIYGLAIATATMGIGELVVKTLVCFKIDHHLRLGIKFFSLDKIKEMGEYAFVTFLNAITNIMTGRLDPYVVALVSNVTTVAYYGVALTLTNYFGEFFRTTMGVLFPLFSQKEGSGDLQGLERWLTIGSKIGTVTATFTGGMVLLYGRVFLVRWLGPHFHASYLYTAILISPMILAYGAFPSVLVLGSTGKHRLATILDGLRGGMNLLLSLILGYQIGAAGVALGTAIPCIIFDVLLKPYYACRSINASPFRLLRKIAGACMQTCILLAPVWLIFGRNVQENYLSLFKLLIFHFAILLIFGFFMFFSQEERKQIKLFVNERLIKRGICRKTVL